MLCLCKLYSTVLKTSLYNTNCAVPIVKLDGMQKYILFIQVCVWETTSIEGLRSIVV